jgi:hypothetical protein
MTGLGRAAPAFVAVRRAAAMPPLGPDAAFGFSRPADRFVSAARLGPAPAASIRKWRVLDGTCDAVFAFGMVLSSATQLRVGGFSLGPGELGLLVWLVLAVSRQAGRGGIWLAPAVSKILFFWALFATAICMGTMTGFVLRDVHDPVWFYHDAMAYGFLAAISCLSVIEFNASPCRFQRVAWFIVTVGTGLLLLQLIDASALIGAPRFDIWYWNRFRGWSDNPAQLALLCAALALLAFHLAETAVRIRFRLIAITCAILPVYVGRLTKTDAFTLVLLAASSIFVTLKVRTWLVMARSGLTFRSAAAWIGILGLPLVLASGALLAPPLASQAADLANAISKEGNKYAKYEVDLRFQIWGEAWNRGLESGMLGLGPGPHLPIPPSIVAGRMGGRQPRNLTHPTVNGTPNFEAHNTLFDLFTQGGLLAVSSFLWLVWISVVNTFKTGLAGLTTLLCGLLLFGMFDLIIRYPILWCGVALSLVAGPSAAAQDLR